MLGEIDIVDFERLEILVAHVFDFLEVDKLFLSIFETQDEFSELFADPSDGSGLLNPDSELAFGLLNVQMALILLLVILFFHIADFAVLDLLAVFEPSHFVKVIHIGVVEGVESVQLAERRGLAAAGLAGTLSEVSLGHFLLSPSSLVHVNIRVLLLVNPIMLVLVELGDPLIILVYILHTCISLI